MPITFKAAMKKYKYDDGSVLVRLTQKDLVSQLKELCNFVNRDIVDNTEYKYFAKKIAEGNLILPNPLSFDTDGLSIDGGHRKRAMLDSGIPYFDVFIHFDVPTEAIKNFDKGRKRTFVHELQINYKRELVKDHGAVKAEQLYNLNTPKFSRWKSLISAVLKYDQERNVPEFEYIDHAVFLTTEAFPSFKDSFSLYDTLVRPSSTSKIPSKLLSKTALDMTMYLMSKINPTAAKEFCGALQYKTQGVDPRLAAITDTLAEGVITLFNQVKAAGSKDTVVRYGTLAAMIMEAFYMWTTVRSTKGKRLGKKKIRETILPSIYVRNKPTDMKFQFPVQHRWYKSVVIIEGTQMKLRKVKRA